jgi:hypothetical protein
MKSAKIIITVLALISCIEPNHKAPVSFESIDYSFFVGDFKSVKIINSGQAYISIIDYYSNQKDKYELKLDPSVMDTLSKLVKSILSVKMDSIFDEPKADHPASISIIIKTNEGLFKCSYKGDFQNEEFSPLYKISEYLNNLIRKTINQSDSLFIYESKSRLILPPPPTSI